MQERINSRRDVMKQMVRKIIDEQKQLTVSLTTLEKRLKEVIGNRGGPLFYKNLADAMLQLEIEGVIEALKSAKSYSRDTRIRDKYRKIIVSNVNESELKQELLLNYQNPISIAYYLKNLESFQNIKDYVKKINEFLKLADENKGFLSANERSFELFGDEKFLSDRSGRRLLTNLKLSYDDLYCFKTFEPFFHIGIAKNENENVLIVENLDTFFSLKKLSLENVRSWDDIYFSMIIYGEGNKVTKSFGHLDELGVPESANIYYFGDFDREGVSIYHRIAKMNNRSVKVMKSFYEKMYERRKAKKSVNKQSLNISAIEYFFEENEFYEEADMKDYLLAGKYVPQEAVNIDILRRMADGTEKPF